MDLHKILPLSKTRLRILFEVYASKRDYLRSIATKLSINPSLCSRILNSLHSAGVLSREPQGKEIFYSMVKGSELLIPLLEEFYLESRAAKSKKLATLVKLLRERKDVFEQCSHVYVFGSYAAGSETKKSDMDVLFVSNNRKSVAKAVREFSILINEQINALVYTEREFEKKLDSKEPLVYSIVNNPKERLIVK